MTLSDILTRYGITMTDLSRKYGIPYRTLQGWQYGERKPPDYVLRLIAAALSTEKQNTAT